MDEEEKSNIISNEYFDLIVEYSGDIDMLDQFKEETINTVNRDLVIVYLPVGQRSEKLVSETGYAVVPKLYGLVDTSVLDETGVRRVQNLPFLNLRGQGILLGFVDTGIDYRNPIFQNADKTSRILSIWDQSIENIEAGEVIYNYGKEFSQEQINEAIMNEDPLSVVPSVDTDGHGTMIAGIAGGSRIEESDFEGVVTLSEFVVVKLKNAKQNMREYFGVPEGVPCFQENDIITGVNYLVEYARKVKRPIAICIALGSNLTAHDGSDYLAFELNKFAQQTGVAINVAAGNEGNAGHHYFGVIEQTTGFDTMEINIAEGEVNIPMQIWGYAPGTYSIDILSPAGEYIPRIPARLGESRAIQFLFEDTNLLIDYILVEAQTGDQLILVRLQNPTPGLWRFKVYGRGDIGLSFHAWLPLRNFIKEETRFLRPNLETTITSPGNAQNVITITAYNHINNSIFLEAGRGFTRTDIIKPDLAAPGMDVFVPLLNNEFGRRSGTSIATAIAAGISAMLLEWGILRGQYISISTAEVKKFLIRGARRLPGVTYPNKEWGYGIIDIFETFNSLREEVD